MSENNLVLRVLFVLTASVVVLTASSASAGNPAYGIVTQAFTTDMETRLIQSNAGSVRLDLNWNELETSDGYYEPAAVNALFANLNTARDRGMEVLLTIAYSPAWANGGLPKQYGPNNYIKWQEFLQDVFWVLGDRPEITFGIWNEPDSDQFLVDDDYATVWKQLWYHAHVARLNVGKPYVKLAGPDHTGYGPRMSYFSYAVNQMHVYGYAHDVVTLHWYSDHPNSLSNLVAVGTTASNPKKLWLTEVGVDRANDTTQANDMENLILSPFANRPVGSLWTRIFVYRMTPYLNFGLMRADGTARPSFAKFQAYAGAVTMPVHYVNLQAYNGWAGGGGNYVVAENGSGDYVNANRPTVGPWETFGLVDFNGGGVQHGDAVSFATVNYPGLPHFLSPVNGGGWLLNAKGSPSGHGVFQIFRMAGAGAVVPGDIVFLRTLSGHFVNASGGGGGVVNADGTAVGAWEQFRIAP